MRWPHCKGALSQVSFWSSPLLIKLFDATEAVVANHTTQVKLKGKLLKGRQADLPTMIWLPEITEPAENFEKFFANKTNKVLDVRNVMLLNYRN